MVQQLGSNTFGTAKWIVSPTASDGTHTTIASALTSASSGDTIFIRPGTYTENLTLKAGVNLTAYDCDQFGSVIIAGKCPLSTAGTVTISGIRLYTNGDYCVEISGSVASQINLVHCFIGGIDHTPLNMSSSSASSALQLIDCQGGCFTTGIGYLDQSSPGITNLEYSQILNVGSTTPSAISAGVVQFLYCLTSCAWSFTGSSAIVGSYTFWNTVGINTTAITYAGGSRGDINHCHVASGSAAAINMTQNLRLFNSQIGSTAAAAIIGGGTLEYGNLGFTNTSAITTTGQTPSDIGPRVQLGDGIAGTGGCQVMSGTGSPSGAVTAPKGSLFLRTDGTTTNDRAYINTDAGTTWTAIVTVA